MAVKLSNDEVSNHESGSDEDENFIAFIATAVVNESDLIEENPSGGELSESSDLQEAYNNLARLLQMMQ